MHIVLSMYSTYIVHAYYSTKSLIQTPNNDIHSIFWCALNGKYFVLYTNDILFHLSEHFSYQNIPWSQCVLDK